MDLQRTRIYSCEVIYERTTTILNDCGDFVSKHVDSNFAETLTVIAPWADDGKAYVVTWLKESLKNANLRIGKITETRIDAFIQVQTR